MAPPRLPGIPPTVIGPIAVLGAVFLVSRWTGYNLAELMYNVPGVELPPAGDDEANDPNFGTGEVIPFPRPAGYPGHIPTTGDPATSDPVADYLSNPSEAGSYPPDHPP